MVDLPINGRNIMSLAGILPGVVGGSVSQNIEDARSGPIMNVNSGRPNMNLFTFNGADFNNPSRNTGINFPPPDAIEQVRILTHDFSAEYAHNPGSQALAFSKSGSNQIHGAVWEFLRNDALNARNSFWADGAVNDRVTKRMSHGFTVLSSYTLAKSIDSSSTNNLGGTVSDPFDLHTERGRSKWDRRDVVVASWLWNKPLRFSNKMLNSLVGGWTLTGITTLQSGAPLTFLMGSDVALDGTGGSQHAQLAPSATASNITIDHPNRNAFITQFFNVNAFVQPRLAPRGVYGNAGRGLIIRTGVRVHRPGGAQGFRHPGNLEAAIPGGILQRAEPGEFCESQPDREQRRLRPYHQRRQRPRDPTGSESHLVISAAGRRAYRLNTFARPRYS